jgi:hypothetical protein
VSSSTNFQNAESQSGTQSSNTNQTKQIDHVHQFTATRKKGAKIKQNILPKIFDHETTQARMLSVVDYEKGKLNIAVLEPKEQKKVTNVSIDLNAIHPLDKMDLHRQTAKMINRDILIANLGIKNLQTINEKLRNQLKNEKLATRTRQIRVEELE